VQSVPYAHLSSNLKLDLPLFLKCSSEENNVPKNISKFYHEVFSGWFTLKKQPSTADEIQREIIWLNKHVKINNKVLFQQNLIDKGLLFISDLIDKGTKKLLNYKQFISKFGKLQQYQYICLIDAIPRQWRISIKDIKVLVEPRNETIYVNSCKTEEKPITAVKSSQLYWHIRSLQKVNPSFVTSWNTKYQIAFSDNEWKNIFLIAKKVTQNTKLIEFHYKIVSRAYASDSFVSNFDKTVSKKCKICNVKNNIQHVFGECNKLYNFWHSFQAWIGGIRGINFIVQTVRVLFGNYENGNFIENFCILHAKWWIHKTRNNDYIHFLDFLVYLKSVIIIEHELSVYQRNLPLFNMRFRSLMKLLNAFGFQLEL
jgi:hypothetical protein